MPYIAYILAAHTGRNQVWRYLATFVLVAVLMLLGAVFPRYLFQAETAAGGLALGNLGQAPALLLGLAVFPYLFVPIGLWIGLSQLHGRSFFSLLNADWSFHWRRFFLSAGLWLGLLAAAELFLAWRIPGRHVLTFDPGAFFPFFALVILLIPIQAAGEEMLYRGYLAQGFGLAGGFWPAWLAPSVLFCLAHFDPAAGWAALLPVLALSLLLGWVTLRSGGLELAIGLHLAHNLFGAALVASPGSPLNGAALLTVRGAYGLALVGPSSITDTAPPLVAGLPPLVALVYLLAGLLYLLLMASLGRRYFPFGLFGSVVRSFGRVTTPRLS